MAKEGTWRPLSVTQGVCCLESTDMDMGMIEPIQFLYTRTIIVYGNCWITAWTSDWPPEASTESAPGAQVNAISPEWPEGAWLHSSSTPFNGWFPRRKDLYLEITPLGALLWAQGKLFISLLFCKRNNLSGPIPVYLTICIPVCHTFMLQLLKNK